MHIKRYHKLIDSYLVKIPYLTKNVFLGKYYFYIDSYISKIIYGCKEKEYFQSEFYLKSRLAKRNCMMTYTRFPFRRRYQCDDDIEIFNDKSLMYDVYGKFIKRDYVVIDQTTKFDEVFAFYQRHKSFISKPVDGYGGTGIVKYSNLKQNELLEVFNQINCKTIFEEIITQNSDIKAFNPTTVNTMRIMTLINESGDVIIPNAILRIGTGETGCVDNFSSGGISVPINVELGVLGVGVNSSGEKFYFHPTTNKKIIGYEIPNWNLYLEFCKEIALVNKKMRIMGWDVIMDDKGDLLMIEGNDTCGFDVIEVPQNNKGFKFIYKEILNSK